MNYREHYLKAIVGSFGSLENMYIATTKLLRTIEPMQKVIKYNVRCKPFTKDQHIKFVNLKNFLESNFPFYAYMSSKAIKDEYEHKPVQVESCIQSFSDQLSYYLKRYNQLYKWYRKYWNKSIVVTPEIFLGSTFVASLKPFDIHYCLKKYDDSFYSYKDLSDNHKAMMFLHMDCISNAVCDILR